MGENYRSIFIELIGGFADGQKYLVGFPPPPLLYVASKPMRPIHLAHDPERVKSTKNLDIGDKTVSFICLVDLSDESKCYLYCREEELPDTLSSKPQIEEAIQYIYRGPAQQKPITHPPLSERHTS